MTTVVYDSAVDILTAGFLGVSHGASGTLHESPPHDEDDIVHVADADAALHALRSGRNVIFQGVPALSVDAARGLAAAAVEAGVIAAVPYTARYHPSAVAARDRVDRGELGMLLSFECAYLQDTLLGTDAHDDVVRAHAGSRVFAAIGAHVCDLIEFVSGERIARLSARTRRVFDRRGGHDVAGEDLAALVLETESGALGTVLVSQMAPGRTDALTLELHGTAASVRIAGERPSELWVGRRGGSHRVDSGTPSGRGDARTAFLWDAYDAIGGGSPRGLPTLHDAVRSAVLAEAVVRSASTGGWVETPTGPAMRHPE